MPSKDPIGIMLYFDKFEQLDKMEDADFRFVIRALVRYCQTGEQPEAFPSLISDIMFGMMRQLIDAEHGNNHKRKKSAADAANARWHNDASNTDANACEDDANACERIQSHTTTDANACETMRTDAQLATSNKQLAINNKQLATSNEQLATSKEEAGVTRARAREGSPTAAADPLITYAVNNLGIMSPRAMEELNSFRDELPDEVIRAGIDAALDANVRTWAYARSILNRYADAGYKTVGEIKAAESKRKAAKANGVNDGNGGKVQNPALNYAQRDYASPASDADIVYMTFDDDDEGG